MVLNGKILGVFPGTVISTVSGVISSLIGFYFGRRANPVLDTMFSNKDKEVSDKLFARFGNTAIIISKALPIISEAISFVSGTTSVSVKTFFYYSLVGHFIVSLVYACMGSFASDLNSTWVAAGVMVAALLVGWIAQVMMKRRTLLK